MKTDERLKLYGRAISTWGEIPQVFMLYEETGELAEAMAKYMRGRYNEDEVITELADVYIMVEQIASMLNFNKFEQEKERKLLRLEERLDKDTKKE